MAADTRAAGLSSATTERPHILRSRETACARRLRSGCGQPIATGLSQPLVASTAGSEPALASRLRIQPGDVVAIALKPSDDGQALIVRLFGASGEDRQAQLHWPTSSPRVWLSDLSENAIKPVEGAIPVAGWDVVTLRAEFHE